MANITMVIGTVREVEGTYSKDSHDELLAAGGEYKKLHEAQNRFYVSA